jgi:hypothetical protein
MENAGCEEPREAVVVKSHKCHTKTSKLIFKLLTSKGSGRHASDAEPLLLLAMSAGSP